MGAGRIGYSPDRVGFVAGKLRYWLPAAVFFPTTIPLIALLLHGWIAGTDLPGNDAELYRSAAAAWLSGSDPWLTGNQQSSFSGSPLTVLAFVPLTAIPEAVFRPLSVIVSWIAGLWLVRRCGLPWYWLAFPPLVTGMMLANPGVVAMALALTIWAPASALLKSFMVLPMLGERRFRSLAITAGLGIMSIVIAPDLWARYLSEFGFIAERLTRMVYYSGTIYRFPALVPLGAVGLLALLRVDKRAAFWLAIPALWPAMEYHYGILVMPVAPILGIPMTLDSEPFATGAIGVYGLYRWAAESGNPRVQALRDRVRELGMAAATA